MEFKEKLNGLGLNAREFGEGFDEEFNEFRRCVRSDDPTGDDGTGSAPSRLASGMVLMP